MPNSDAKSVFGHDNYYKLSPLERGTSEIRGLRISKNNEDALFARFTRSGMTLMYYCHP